MSIITTDEIVIEKRRKHGVGDPRSSSTPNNRLWPGDETTETWGVWSPRSWLRSLHRPPVTTETWGGYLFSECYLFGLTGPIHTEGCGVG